MENLLAALSENVSEECFNEILDIVEAIINETSPKARQELLNGRNNQVMQAQRNSDIKHAKLEQTKVKRKSDLTGERKDYKLDNEVKQADRELSAAKAKLKRATSLVNRLNNRVPVTKTKYVDGNSNIV